MGSIIIANLKGFVNPGEISEFIANKYHTIVRAEAGRNTTREYDDSFTKCIIFDIYHTDTVDIFYYYTKEKDKENLDYFRRYGLEEMVLSDTTYLSTEIFPNRKEIMQSIVEEFGGWICFDDQLEEHRYHYFEGKRNINLSPENKSMYEQLAPHAQSYFLLKNVTFQDAINQIRIFKSIKSMDFVRYSIEIVAAMFGLSYKEVKDAVDGKTYWISSSNIL